MRKLTFTNSRGESIVLGNSRPFLVTRLEEVGPTITQTQKSPYQDGATFLDSLLDPRQITIEGSIMRRTGEEIFACRHRLTTVFNPKLGPGTLRYEHDGGVREIQAVVDSLPFFPDRSGQPTQRFLLNLLCPDPYWRTPAITEEPAYEPLFQFPFEGPFQMGLQRDRRIIVNDGDAPAPLYVEFFGPALNPAIINNTTGEYIRVNQELHEGERMIIDTSDGSKSVYFVDANGNERNVFHWIDLNSTFFKLIVGENDIEYTADSDIQGAVVNISYSKLYTAV